MLTFSYAGVARQLGLMFSDDRAVSLVPTIVDSVTISAVLAGG